MAAAQTVKLSDRTPACLRSASPDQTGGMLAILVILALLVLAGIVLGFVIKWLFIIAVVAALIWLITFFAGRARANL